MSVTAVVTPSLAIGHRISRDAWVMRIGVTLLVVWLNAGILLAFEGSDGSQYQLFALGALLILSALLNAYSTRRGRGIRQRYLSPLIFSPAAVLKAGN